MGKHRGLKLFFISGVMLVLFTGYARETAFVRGDEGYALANESSVQAQASSAPAVPVAAQQTFPPATPPVNVQESKKEAAAGAKPEANAPARQAKPEEAGAVSAEKPKKLKRVALTFDDGPDAKYTPLILDELKKCDVKATFFVVGVQVNKYGDMLERIVKEGHAIGNHSWDHANLTKRTPEQIGEEIGKTDEAIRKRLGSVPDLFRAPYGAADDNVKKAVATSQRHLIGWTVDTRDWAGTPANEIMDNIKKHTKPDGIILMHSFGGKNGKLDNTVEVLPRMIDFLKGEGYSFVTVPELVDGQRS